MVASIIVKDKRLILRISRWIIYSELLTDYTKMKKVNSGKFSWFLFGWSWEVETTMQKTKWWTFLFWTSWFQLVWIFLKVTGMLWANTCNLLTSGRIGKELLLNFCKYALLALLWLAVLEERIFFLFAVNEIFLFLWENLASHNANWRTLKITWTVTEAVRVWCLRNVSGMKRFLRRIRMFGLSKMREEYDTHVNIFIITIK